MHAEILVRKRFDFVYSGSQCGYLPVCIRIKTIIKDLPFTCAGFFLILVFCECYIVDRRKIAGINSHCLGHHWSDDNMTS